MFIKYPDLIKKYRPKAKKKALKINSFSEPIIILYAIMAGDVAGGPYENGMTLPLKDVTSLDLFENKKCTWSDDSLISIAVYKATQTIKQKKLREQKAIDEYIYWYRMLAKKYPDCGFGTQFFNWTVKDIDNEEYKSFGNGAAMRSGIIGAMFERIDDVIINAFNSAWPTHSHPEGIEGAIVTAVLVWMANNEYTKEEMQEYVLKFYPFKDTSLRYFNNVNAGLSLKDLTISNKFQTFNVKCSTAVPLAFINFFEANNYIDSLKNALLYPCDADTVMAITGGIAGAYYKPGFEEFDIINSFLPEYLISLINTHLK